jgi:very-short-patch-repair endonuclease
LGGDEGEGAMKAWLISRARQLRRASTDAEKALWQGLRARQLEGLKFRRQHPVGKYIVDFICLEKALIVELDGGQHAEDAQREKDKTRDQWLEGEGFTVLRFCDHEVLTNTEGVLDVIGRVCCGLPSGDGEE